MKAFTFYSKEEFDLRLLFKQLQDYGKVNCDFETFSKLYEEWLKKAYPTCPINAATIIQDDELFTLFVIFLANKDI